MGQERRRGADEPSWISEGERKKVRQQRPSVLTNPCTKRVSLSMLQQLILVTAAYQQAVPLNRCTPCSQIILKPMKITICVHRILAKPNLKPSFRYIPVYRTVRSEFVSAVFENTVRNKDIDISFKISFCFMLLRWANVYNVFDEKSKYKIIKRGVR